ncbi:autotransporter outer membrane beta-barrel domain-containing protein [Pseudomonas knackmussii]|uniref:autotransporter outer membrane beta-barrel domain-containing protein n=1 Tax=Pseudomonas knackmussii TaxID=65741 RepID=UPI0013634C9E|nr:autotransporter outer membrane beta-barrel domain-containing protein [Pseudomonas knackmussii]
MPTPLDFQSLRVPGPPFRRSALSLLVVLLATLCGVARADQINVEDGSTHIASPDENGSGWSLSGGSTLVLDGLDADHISIGSSGSAIVSDADITSADSYGLSGNGAGCKPAEPCGIVFEVTGSQITGQIGVAARGGTTVTLVDTKVRGKGEGTSSDTGFDVIAADDSAVLLEGSNLSALDGSSLVGDVHGAYIYPSLLSNFGVAFPTSLLHLDDSYLEGVTGSAIVVGDDLQSQYPDYWPLGEATIEVTNGSQVIGGNGVLLEVANANIVHFIVDDSRLSGDILAAEESTTDVVLQNGAELNGQLHGVDALSLFASQFTGSMHVTQGEATLVIADGSTASAENGQLLDVQGGSASMLVDASTANTDLQVIDGTRVDVKLQNGAQLNGEMTVTGGEASLSIVNGSSVNSDSGTLIDVQGGSAQVVIDSSNVSGNILAGGESTNVFVQNGAQLNGQLNATAGDNQLLVDNSTFTGEVLASGGSTDVIVQNGAQLNGQMTVSDGEASLAILDGSSIANANGPLLDVLGGTVQMIVDNSSVGGDVLAEGGSTKVYVQNDAQFDGHLTVTGGEASLIVSNGAQANAGSPLLDVQGGSGELIVDNATATGEVVASGDGTANVTLQNFGVFTGQLENVSQLDLNSGGTWNMVGDARVENVAMQGGTINFGDGAEYRTLTLGSLSGNGGFAMNTDIAAGKGDLLNVEGQATGDYQLRFKNTGAEVDEGSLQVVHTGGGDANFSVLGGGVDVGTYQFQLAQHGDDWFLEATNEITPSTASVLGLFSAAPSVWYGELSSLRSRMGEVRNGQGSGAWVRTYANRYKLSADADLTYAQNQHGLSLGADGQLPTSDGQWLLGVLAGTSKSDLDLKRGTSGEVDSYYVGLYSTWLADSGFYVDAVLKLNRFDNSSDVRMSDGTKAEGDYNNTGLGLSVEAGKHIKLPDDWFIEPYAQFAALRVNGDDYELDNGMQASSNHANSLLGKLGSSFGKRIPLANGGFAEPYLKLALAHEFADNNLVRVNGDRFNNDLSGTRGEIGGGVAAQVSEKLQLHLDLDYSKGKNIEQPYGVNLGLRYNF